MHAYKAKCSISYRVLVIEVYSLKEMLALCFYQQDCDLATIRSPLSFLFSMLHVLSICTAVATAAYSFTDAAKLYTIVMFWHTNCNSDWWLPWLFLRRLLIFQLAEQLRGSSVFYPVDTNTYGYEVFRQRRQLKKESHNYLIALHLSVLKVFSCRKEKT